MFRPCSTQQTKLIIDIKTTLISVGGASKNFKLLDVELLPNPPVMGVLTLDLHNW